MYRLERTDNVIRKAYEMALIPSVLSILGGCINIIVDGILVGQKIGPDGLAAISLCVPVYLVICIFASLFVTGAGINAAKEVGNRRPDLVKRYLGSSVFICMILSVVFALTGQLVTDEIVSTFGESYQVVEYARQYTYVTLVLAAPKVFIYIPFNFLRIDGKNKLCMNMMFIMAGGNVALDLLFLYKFDFGIYGVATASILATAIACIFGFYYLHKGQTSFDRKLYIPSAEMLKAMIISGSPAAVNNIMQTVRIMFINGVLMVYGGVEMVAVFSVINGVGAFAEAITLGVPQAGQAILGIFYGEKDIKSQELLLKNEFIFGIVLSLVFGIAIVAGNTLIKSLYGLDSSLLIPMLMMALSVVPALFNNILSTFYNVTGHNTFANGIIISKTFVFTLISLWILGWFNIGPWLFLVMTEVFTIIAWYIAILIIHRADNIKSKYLLVKMKDLPEELVYFSFSSSTDRVSDAGKYYLNYCLDHSMDTQTAEKMAFVVEKVIALTMNLNGSKKVNFDIRTYKEGDSFFIGFRNDGISYNSFLKDVGDDIKTDYMSVKDIVTNLSYDNIFGLNLMTIEV